MIGLGTLCCRSSLLLAAVGMAACRPHARTPPDPVDPDTIWSRAEDFAPYLHPRPSDSSRIDTAWGWTLSPIITPAPTPPPRAVLREVRTFTFDGFDRTVFEYTFGDPVPGVFASYRAAPRRCSDAVPADVRATDTLVVVATTAQQFDPDNAARSSVLFTDRSVDAPALRSVIMGCGGVTNQVAWALGVDGRQPFRVFTLEDPVRVVVDVRHPRQP